MKPANFVERICFVATPTTRLYNHSCRFIRCRHRFAVKTDHRPHLALDSRTQRLSAGTCHCAASFRCPSYLSLCLPSGMQPGRSRIKGMICRSTVVYYFLVKCAHINLQLKVAKVTPSELLTQRWFSRPLWSANCPPKNRRKIGESGAYLASGRIAGSLISHFYYFRLWPQSLTLF